MTHDLHFVMLLFTMSWHITVRCNLSLSCELSKWALTWHVLSLCQMTCQYVTQYQVTVMQRPVNMAHNNWLLSLRDLSHTATYHFRTVTCHFVIKWTVTISNRDLSLSHRDLSLCHSVTCHCHCHIGTYHYVTECNVRSFLHPTDRGECDHSYLTQTYHQYKEAYRQVLYGT